MRINTKWEVKKLGEVCIVLVDGNWIESKDQSHKGIRLIQTGNIGMGFFRNKESKIRFITEETFKRINCTEVFSGDCLISRLPDPVGKACVVPNLSSKMITAVDCSIIRFKPFINSAFMNYFFQTPKYLNEIKQKCTGTTRTRISRKNLEKILVPVPSLLEQKKIVAKLDKFSENIKKLEKTARKNLQNAKDLFNSVLNETFKNKSVVDSRQIDKTLISKMYWEVEKFGDCIEKVIYSVKVQKKDFLCVGNFPIISQENELINGYYNDEKKLFKIKKPIIIFGDHTRVFKYIDFDFILGADGVKIIQPKGVLDTKFLYYYLMNKPLKSLGYSRHYRELREINVCYPNDILEQKKIIAKLDKLSEETKKLEIIYQKKIYGLAELKKSVLKQTFDYG